MYHVSSLPMYFPADFDLSIARFCARLIADAYRMYGQWEKQDKPRKESGFTWQTPSGTGLTFSSPIWSTMKTFFIIDESEPFGFVASDGTGKGYLVFRGTASFNNWMTDLDADHEPYDLVNGYGEVHDGFLKLWKSMREDALSALEEVGVIDSLWITGHSLGGGLSTVAVPDIITQKTFQRVEHYSFASPRVGNPAFTGAYNDNGVKTFRVVNTCDFVPQLPGAILGAYTFKHVGHPVNFSAQYGSVAHNHNHAHAYCYALDNPQQPERSETLSRCS